jgi:hypothetical protein
MSDIEAAAAAGIGLRIRLARQEPDHPLGGAEQTPSHTVVADLKAALALLQGLAIDTMIARRLHDSARPS